MLPDSASQSREKYSSAGHHTGYWRSILLGGPEYYPGTPSKCTMDNMAATNLNRSCEQGQGGVEAVDVSDIIHTLPGFIWAGMRHAMESSVAHP